MVVITVIKTKIELKEYIEADNWYYSKHYSKFDHKIFMFLQDPQYLLRKYKIYLRKEEYYLNNNRNKFDVFMRLLYLRKKNKLGNKLGVLIPPNTFEKGLMIMHHGEIIVNPNAKVGEYCILHGGNCIGNNGKDEAAPAIGNYVDIGIGAKIIGGVSVADEVKIGANAVVIKSCYNRGSVLVGIPAIEK